MRILRGLVAGVFTAIAVAFIAPFAVAAGIFPGYPAATTVPQYGCVPSDVYGPGYTANNQGLIPQTVCLTPGQITGDALQSPLNDYPNIPIGSVAYGSLGTNTTPVSGTVYVSSFRLPVDITATAIACMNGGTAGTDKLLYSIYSSTGTLLANTATAGTTASGTDAFQELALTANLTMPAGLYYLGWQTNGTTTRFRTVAASTYINVASGSATGTFGTLPAITPPTTFTADKAPICYVEGAASAS